MRADFTTYNPATGEKLADYKWADVDAVTASLEKLSAGFKVWQNISLSGRQQKLHSAIKGFKKYKNEIAQSMTREMGKPITQSYLEVDKSIQGIEYICNHSYTFFESYSLKGVSDLNLSHKLLFKPKGVIVGLMPWNFPLWQAVRMVFPALLMGNVVLLKHSEITPTVGVYLQKIFTEAGLDNVFQHQLFSHDLTERVISDVRVSGVSLTGSVKAGKAVGEIAGRHLKKVVFELGGSDAYVVLRDADLKRAANVVAKSRLLNTGQTCISAKRAIVANSVCDAFLKELIAVLDRQIYLNPEDERATIGPLASSKFSQLEELRVNYCEKFCELVFAKGVDQKQVETLAVNREKQAFVPIRVFKVKNPISEEFRNYIKSNEFFSPTLLVFTFENEEEAIELANSTDFGLGGAIFSQDIVRAELLAAKMHTGLVAINESVRSDIAIPFGGVKQSGIGREMGELGCYEFVDVQVLSTYRGGEV